MSENGGSLKSFLTGGILGFLAGLFFAPQKGEETQKIAKDSFLSLWQEAEKGVKDLLGEVEKVAESLETDKSQEEISAKAEQKPPGTKAGPRHLPGPRFFKGIRR